MVATSNLIPALTEIGFSAVNFISDRSLVSAYIGPILSVIRISAKPYIGATLIRGTCEVSIYMSMRGIHFSDAFSSVYWMTCFEMLVRAFVTSLAHVQPFIQYT